MLYLLKSYHRTILCAYCKPSPYIVWEKTMSILTITLSSGSPGTLAVSDIDEFAKRLRGRLVRRGDADYADLLCP
jgi:hypothetical protein